MLLDVKITILYIVYIIRLGKVSRIYYENIFLMNHVTRGLVFCILIESLPYLTKTRFCNIGSWKFLVALIPIEPQVPWQTAPCSYYFIDTTEKRQN